MKKVILLSIMAGGMLLSTSCSSDTIEENELKATNLVASGSEGCETGFAICAINISTCFIDEGFGRWGWTIGPVSPGKHVFAVYSGAGQCDTSKGQLAGKIRLNYNGDTGEATTTYVANEGYVFKETHLYIGNEPYPMQKKGKKVTPTVAPGQYPFQHDNLNNVTRDSYQVTDLSGDIFIIAHAIVCTTAPE